MGFDGIPRVDKSRENQPWIFIGKWSGNWSFWPPDARANSLEKTLMLGKIEGRRRRGQQTMRWLDDMTDSVDVSLSKIWETVKDREAWHAIVCGVLKSQIWLRTEQQQRKPEILFSYHITRTTITRTKITRTIFMSHYIENNAAFMDK